MRVWQRSRPIDEAMAASRWRPGLRIPQCRGEILLHYDLGDVIVASGFAPGCMFNQPDLERALRAKLADYPEVEIRLGVRFEGLDAIDGNTVRATIADAQGEPQVVEARFVVGCDGASSAVRKALGIGHFDYDFDEPWLVIDAQVKRRGPPPLAQSADLRS